MMGGARKFSEKEKLLTQVAAQSRGLIYSVLRISGGQRQCNSESCEVPN